MIISTLVCRFYASLPKHLVVNLPALSPTMNSGSIAIWRKAPGDKVEPGDVLVEIETDKAQMEFEAPEEGFLAKVLIPEGTKDVAVSTPMAIIVNKKEDIEAFKDYQPSTEGENPNEPTISNTDSERKITETKSEPSKSDISSRVKASPLAKNLAKQHDINLFSVTRGSGPNNRIIKDDIMQAINQKASTATTTAEYVDIPVSNMRRTIANRLTKSKQDIPHYYLTKDIRLDALEAARSQFPAEQKPTLNTFILKAAAYALKQCPQVNSVWQEDVIRQYNRADICMAVATSTGLITPIVTDVYARSLSSIHSTLTDLYKKARDNRLAPNEYQGGTFTISSLGTKDICEFTAIINAPQSAILAIGKGEPRVLVTKNGGMEIAKVMTVTLSCDHRVIDGAVGADWLQHFQAAMENPLVMLL